MPRCGPDLTVLHGPAGAVGGVEMSFADPEELENLDEDALQARFDAAQRTGEPESEDFSDMVAEHQVCAHGRQVQSAWLADR